MEVIGHQWWWEFRYPELGVTTANELYIPAGRTVNFALRMVAAEPLSVGEARRLRGTGWEGDLETMRGSRAG